MSHPRITRKRWLVQIALLAALFLTPFVTVGGHPLLRMDIAARTLFMFGAPIRIDQFYLVLLATLCVLGFFLLLTALLGRVWCGWLCPQTVFNDLADELGRRLSRVLPGGIAVAAGHGVFLVISALFSFNLFCWFLAPAEVASRLVHAAEHPALTAFFLLFTGGGYLNLLLVKRSFCRSYCPYGRFQAVLMDEGTLNLSFLPETADRCLRCGACVRSCPMGIDIRQGFQIECINCGRCIDACRGVMERRPGGAGLIDYRFGTAAGGRPRLGAKSLILLVLTLLFGVLLAWGVGGRRESAFALARIATVEPRLTPDGFQLQPWKAVIGNRTDAVATYRVAAAPGTPGDVSLLGPVDAIPVPPNEHREITFLLRLRQDAPSGRRVSLVLLAGGKEHARQEIRP